MAERRRGGRRWPSTSTATAIRKYVGAYYAVLGRVDAVVFTAGVGENSAPVRAASATGSGGPRHRARPERNSGRVGRAARTISPDGSPVAVLVVPTNEELEIAEQALAVVRG